MFYLKILLGYVKISFFRFYYVCDYEKKYLFLHR